MNIGITCHPTVGGSGAVAAELGKMLAARGHDVHIIAYRVPFRLGPFNERLTFHQVDFTPYAVFEHAPMDLALASKMTEVARESRLDLFHVHYAIPYAVSAFLARQILGAAAPRLVTTLHGTDITVVGQDRSLFEVTKFAIEQSSAVTCVSEFLRQETRTEFGISQPIDVVPNFVDVELYSRMDEPRPARLLQPDERVLLHISNFRAVKRPLDVVRIFERVVQRVPRAVLLMLGDGPERASAEGLSRRLGLRDRVRFLGVKDSIREIAQHADVFLLPSELESFGLSALEAMACGVPVVTTNTGGLPELVVHGETGFLSEVGAIDEMAARTVDLLLDEERRRSIGKAGQLRAKQLFDSADVVSAYERVFERALAESR